MLKNTTKRKVVLWAGMVLAVLLIGFWSLYIVNSWFSIHQFNFQIPVRFHKPIWITHRPIPIEKEAQAFYIQPVPEYSDPTEQMIFTKFAKAFGEKVGHQAVAVSWAENGSRQCDRVSKPNSDGSVDYGLWQINSVHLKRFRLSQIIDCEKSTDIAVQLYGEQGWRPWVAFNNGSWKNYPNLKGQ